MEGSSLNGGMGQMGLICMKGDVPSVREGLPESSTGEQLKAKIILPNPFARQAGQYPL